MNTDIRKRGDNCGLSIEAWLQIRKEAATGLNPETAEVHWEYGYTLDPYGYGDLPEECKQVGRNCFARSPASDVWVWFGDLPQITRQRLWELQEKNLAFPAGLP